MREGSLRDQSSDIQRLMEAAKEEAGLSHLAMTLTARRAAPGMLRRDGGKVNLVVWKPEKGHPMALDLLPAGSQQLLGMAVDIGTTTVVAYYYDLTTGKLLDTQSALNPQRAFGADVISRIAAAGSEQGLEQQAAAIRNLLRDMTKGFERNTGCDPRRLYHVTIAANTTMLHLLCALSH